MFDFKGAIFDLDGTIIDSMNIWEKIDIEFLLKRNIKMPDDYMKNINTMSFEDAAKYTKERFNLNESKESLIKEWNEMAIYEYSNNIKLKPNVKKYLQKLKENNIKIALATASPKELYEPVLKNNEVYDYFNAFVTVKEVNLDKSNPEIYLLASKKLNLNPKDCIGFEDILVGINTMKKIGIKTIGVYDKYSSDDIKDIKSSSDKFIYNFEELL